MLLIHLFVHNSIVTHFINVFPAFPNFHFICSSNLLSNTCYFHYNDITQHLKKNNNPNCLPLFQAPQNVLLEICAKQLLTQSCIIIGLKTRPGVSSVHFTTLKSVLQHQQPMHENLCFALKKYWIEYQCCKFTNSDSFFK